MSFTSGTSRCAAWHYAGTNGWCVVMGSGLGVPKEPGTDRFAARFHAAGYTVFAFDYRHWGASEGNPRSVVRVRDQIADWRAAIKRAAELPEVAPGQVALWGFSLAGGHVLNVAAHDPAVAGVISQTPNVDGLAATRNALRHQQPVATLRLIGRSLGDQLRGLVRRPPWTVPVAGPPGTVAVLTTPDATDAGRALDPANKYPQWKQSIAARSVLALGSYRPGRRAKHVTCPTLIVVCTDDQSALAAPAIKASERLVRGELVQLRGGHYEPFLTEHESAVEAELAFLNRLLESHHAEPGAS